ncbi:MAG TPA: glycosyltransferase family 39 protein [Longimicrobium sp.]
MLALALGVLLRLGQYAVSRALWLDEALLATNFLRRGFLGLAQPLDRGPTAPLGFLWLEKAASLAIGSSEYALRLVPLLAGLATLLLLPRVARRYVSRPALPLAVALVALAPFLVYYSSEVKPYAFDALASVALLGLAASAARRRGDGRTMATFALAGAALVWLSQPAVFVLAGAGLCLGLRALRLRDRRWIAMLAATAAVWIVSFAGAYLVSRRQLIDPEYMRAFWRSGFLPLRPRTVMDWTWIPRMATRVFREPLGILGRDPTPLSVVAAAAAALAFALGCAWMWRHGRRFRLALLVSPMLLAIVASAAEVYPFGSTAQAGGRVLIFLIPSLAFIVAEGVAALPRMLPRAAGRIAFALAALLVLLPAASYAAFSVPQLRGEIKPLLEYANQQRRPGDVMYVYYNGLPSFEYYAGRYGWDAAHTVRGVCARLRPQAYVEDLARLRGLPRVWVLMVDGTPVGEFDEKPLIVGFLEHVGRRLDDQVAVGASLYLYDLRPGPSDPGPFSIAVPPLPRDPAMDCRGAWAPLPNAR